jgi:hypothetical protein
VVWPLRGGCLHRTTARSAVEAARPLIQPVPLSAIEPALRERGTDLDRSGKLLRGASDASASFDPLRATVSRPSFSDVSDSKPASLLTSLSRPTPNGINSQNH